MADGDSSIDEQPSYHIANAHSLVWHGSHGDDLALAGTHAAIAQAMLLERIERHLAVIAEHLTLPARTVADPGPVHYG